MRAWRWTRAPTAFIPVRAAGIAGLLHRDAIRIRMDAGSLPEGWTVWSDEARKVVLVYRPDVFDTVDFPAPCLPTIYVSKGRRGRRPGRERPPPDADWYVTLSLEPDVSLPTETADTRRTATVLAVDLAERFATGDIDVRALYQVPRDDYLDRLESLTG